MAISWIDLETMLIPEVLILPLIAVLILSRTYTHQWFILTGALTLFLIHLIIHLIVPDGFGMGDVFYAAAVGLMLPPHLLLVWFVTTYALGTIVGLGLIALNKMGRKTPLPFAPIMFAGTLITYFLGSYIYNWYLTLFL
jgi:prepilin signal peptidase PulO-like enzyme (type II secretory pathway)